MFQFRQILQKVVEEIPQNNLYNFLYIALGSACELETHIIIAKEIGYLSNIDNLTKKINEVRKMLNGLINSLKKGNH